MNLSASDNGTTVTVHRGDDIVLTLDENPTTGYVWAIDKTNSSILTLNSSDYTSSGVGLAGAGGTRTFTFTAEQPGTVNLALKDWRSWEGDSSIVGRFAVTIVVQ